MVNRKKKLSVYFVMIYNSIYCDTGHPFIIVISEDP